MAGKLARFIRNHLTGIKGDYVLNAAKTPDLAGISEIHLYIHIPFCRSICPFCPYNKIVYDQAYAGPYRDALIKEIDLYANALGKIEIRSVYIGGGTPTRLIDELRDIFVALRAKFELVGDIGIETGPTEITNENISKMKAIGINMVSLGVQSFDQKYLDFMHRGYSSEQSRAAIKLLMTNFKNVNIDMIASLPGQSRMELEQDLLEIIKVGAEQVTLYPLFNFPYSSVRKYVEHRQVKKPNLIQRRHQYKLIDSFFIENGFERSSVWSYKKHCLKRYSSATRDLYIGLGAGAGSLLPAGFYFNTFSVHEYIQTCSKGEFATALHMPFTSRMHDYFWLYWRLYDTRVSRSEFMKRFEGDSKLRRIISTLKLIGWLKRADDNYELTETGAFWAHLCQNHFVLDYINTVWSTCMRDAWPDQISLDK